MANLRWAEAAIREYAPNGDGIAQIVRDRFNRELETVPAESLAEIVVKLTKNDKLFAIAKSLESAAYAVHPPSFDHLDGDAKSYVGALLDFVRVDRPKFARAWATKTPLPPVDSAFASGSPVTSSGEVGKEQKLL